MERTVASTIRIEALHHILMALGMLLICWVSIKFDTETFWVHFNQLIKLATFMEPFKKTVSLETNLNLRFIQGSVPQMTFGWGYPISIFTTFEIKHPKN